MLFNSTSITLFIPFTMNKQLYFVLTCKLLIGKSFLFCHHFVCYRKVLRFMNKVLIDKNLLTKKLLKVVIRDKVILRESFH